MNHFVFLFKTQINVGKRIIEYAKVQKSNHARKARFLQIVFVLKNMISRCIDTLLELITTLVI